MCPPSHGLGTAALLGGRCCPAHVGLIIEHLLSIAAAQGRFPLAASCEGANFMYAGCLQRGRRESCGAGRPRGDGGLCPRQGQAGQKGAKAAWRERGSSSHWGYGEAGSKSRRRLAWPGSVEGCQGLFSETSLVVTSQAWSNASPVLLAQADPSDSRRVLREDSSPLCDGQPQCQAGRHLN